MSCDAPIIVPGKEGKILSFKISASVSVQGVRFRGDLGTDNFLPATTGRHRNRDTCFSLGAGLPYAWRSLPSLRNQHNRLARIS